MPFGEEIYANIGGRSESQKYTQNGVDNIRKRFTGYEKDTETGLDFAEARYYHNEHGRFTAVDPLLESEKPEDPQSFNRYTYAMNNPTNLVDPSGMISSSTGANGAPQKTKLIIDLFITLEPGQETKEGKKAFEKLRKEARKKGIIINIYRSENGAATAKKFIESIQKDGRVTVLIGHSFSDAENAPKARGIGIWFWNKNRPTSISTQENKDKKKSTDAVDGIKAKASMVAVLTCNFGNAFDKLGSTIGTAFISTFNGKQGDVGVGESGIDAQYAAGYKLVEAVVNGGDAKKAKDAAVKGFDSQRRLPMDKGDTIVMRTLKPIRN